VARGLGRSADAWRLAPPARCSISYKSAAIAIAPGGSLAYRLQVTLAVPGLHPRPLARPDGERHV
jgi:hypothetical protein